MVGGVVESKLLGGRDRAKLDSFSGRLGKLRCAE